MFFVYKKRTYIQDFVAKSEQETSATGREDAKNGKNGLEESETEKIEIENEEATNERDKLNQS
jgi:hypothetical protein